MVIAGAVSKWYFTADKSKDLPRFPCCGSFRRTCRYAPRCTSNRVSTLPCPPPVHTVSTLVRCDCAWLSIDGHRELIDVLGRFHLGSVAFGSLIIAIVQFIRLVLAYLDRKTKGLQVRVSHQFCPPSAALCGCTHGIQQRRGLIGVVGMQSRYVRGICLCPHCCDGTLCGPLCVLGQQRSKIWKAIFCCIQCCMWCFEKCLKFIT